MESIEYVLNCNDNEPGRYATSRVLKRAGFLVREAATGTEALRIANESPPAVIVCDVNLPDMTGIDVCRILKSQPHTAATMVLQVSATSVALSDRVASLSAGADSFLVEPVEAEELEAVTRALLRLHRSEAALRRALAERELLLREVNHRVKNSLQLVLSMLNLQSNEFEDTAARERFSKAIARVTAIASIHERLYQDVDPLTVEMKDYLEGLCSELARVGMGDSPDAKLETQLSTLRLGTEQGVAVALIVNELVLNALKHGKTSIRAAHIVVRLAADPGGSATLTVSDNGSSSVAHPNERAGLGTRLIKMLVRQLDGELAVERTDRGYLARVSFPVRTSG